MVGSSKDPNVLSWTYPARKMHQACSKFSGRSVKDAHPIPALGRPFSPTSHPCFVCTQTNRFLWGELRPRSGVTRHEKAGVVASSRCRVRFLRNEALRICHKGNEIARGIINFSSDELPLGRVGRGGFRTGGGWVWLMVFMCFA